MNTSLRIALIIALIIYFAGLFVLLKRKNLTLKYTLLWLAAGVIMLIIAMFPGQFERLTSAIGIAYMYNGLFAILIFAIIIILISITSIVSLQNEKIRRLAQQCAMYEKRIRELEDAVSEDGSKTN